MYLLFQAPFSWLGWSSSLQPRGVFVPRNRFFIFFTASLPRSVFVLTVCFCKNLPVEEMLPKLHLQNSMARENGQRGACFTLTSGNQFINPFPRKTRVIQIGGNYKSFKSCFFRANCCSSQRKFHPRPPFILILTSPVHNSMISIMLLAENSLSEPSTPNANRREHHV